MTYLVGTHWFICDVCGQKYRSTEKKKRWDGLIVCPDDFEQDHPQKFIRVEADGQAVPNPRPRPEDVFKEGLACTILTRTPTAEVGVADCMTVDAIPNINWPDYNLPRPIIPSAPTPILLDTFTAADGTDPTTRDVDVHPALAGASRWQVRDVGYVAGEILSNSLHTTSAVDQVSLVITPTSGGVLADFSAGVTAVIYADALADGFCMLWLENASQNDGIKIQLFGPNLDVLVYGEISGTYPDWEPAAGLVMASGMRKIAVHIGADDMGYLIIDGVEIASQSLITSGPWINQNWNQIRVDVESNTDAYINQAGLYTGITLSEAIALTT
jgi:hypothetical protein